MNEKYLKNPELLLLKKPFTRGGDYEESNSGESSIDKNTMLTAELPQDEGKPISQSQYLREYDPTRHDIHFNKSIPSIVAEMKDGSTYELKFNRVAIPYQKNIHAKQVQHMCGNNMKFLLINQEPSESQKNTYKQFKEQWLLRGMEHQKMKFVSRQKSTGDSAMVFSMYEGKLNVRVLSYKEGYTIIPQYDDYSNIESISLYYKRAEGYYIDTYDSTHMYRHYKSSKTSEGTNPEWELIFNTLHNFDQIPIVYKRGYVAWEMSQSIIEAYEILYNIDMVIKKRHGWGKLYIKGNIDKKMDQLNGSIILSDSHPEGKGDAKYLTPPNAEGITELMKGLKQNIQIASSTTFILPDDINVSGDVSGVAVKLTQSMDYELAIQTARDYANEANSMKNLFIQGLSKETNSSFKLDKTASILAEFDIWMPQNDEAIYNTLLQLHGVGLTSTETATSLIGHNAPDELERLKKQKAEDAETEKEKNVDMSVQQMP